MDDVGVRELRQNLSVYLQDPAGGDAPGDGPRPPGRILTPTRSTGESVLDELEAQGRLIRPSSPRPRPLPKPRPPTPGARAVNRVEPDRIDEAEELLADMTFLIVDRLLTARAGWIRPATVRSLDAIHIASAIAMARDLETSVTYDGRMVEAGQMAGLPVASPGSAAA